MMDSFQYEDLSESGSEKRTFLRRCFSCRSRIGTSWMSASVLILNAVLAPGIMSLPDAFSRSGGIGVGVGMQLFLLLFIVGSLYTLVSCAEANAQDTYPDVIRVVCGPTAEVVSALCVACYCYTFCVCSLVLVGDQLEKFFSDVYGDDYHLHWYMTRYFLLPLTSSICILPLCFTTKIEFLTNFSVLGNLMVLYCVVLVVYKYFTNDVHQGTIDYRPTSWRDLLSVIPIWCGNYQCHVEVVPIIATLRGNNSRLFYLSLLVAITLCATFYTLIATFGYLSFGTEVAPDILLQYTSGPDVMAAAIAVALKMCMTYPTIHFCGRSAIENLWVRGQGLTPSEVVQGEAWRRVVITLVTFGVVLIASLIVPNLIVIVPILGSASALLMFIIPGCCLVQMCKGAYLMGHKYVVVLAVAAILMTSLGAFIVGFSWSDLVVQLMTKKDFLETGEEMLNDIASSTSTLTPTTTLHG